MVVYASIPSQTVSLLPDFGMRCLHRTLTQLRSAYSRRWYSDLERLAKLRSDTEVLANELNIVRENAERIRVMDDIHFYAQGEQTPVSPAMLTAFAKHPNKQSSLLQGSLFLHRELPFRLAMRVQVCRCCLLGGCASDLNAV